MLDEADTATGLASIQPRPNSPANNQDISLDDLNRSSRQYADKISQDTDLAHGPDVAGDLFLTRVS